MLRKTFRTTGLVTALLALALLAAPAAAEDLTIISQVTTKKGAPTTSTQYVSSDKIRTSDGRIDTIIDVASGRMIQIDHKKKSYYETSLEDLRAHFAELEKMLEQTPMLANMFGRATEVQVREGSGSRTVAGYACRQYLVSMGDKFKFELWVAPDLEAPIQYHDAKKLTYAAMGPMGARFEKMYDAMKKIQGFPLWSKVETAIMGFDMEVVSEATEVREGPLPAGTFEPPAGYKMQKSSPFK